MPEISIIIAIYNVRALLQRCLDHISAQTFRNFEVIMIDDGSTDGSDRICQAMAQSDPRFHHIRQENGGVAHARQSGLQLATGKYVIHMDPDDWTDPEMLAVMYDEAEKRQSDILITDFFVHMGGKEILSCQRPMSMKEGQDLTPDGLIHDYLNGLHGSTWNKLVRRDFLVKHQLHFAEGINYCEDLLFNINLMKYPARISYLPAAFYHYDTDSNPNAITGNYTHATYVMRKQFIQALSTLLPEARYQEDISSFKIRVKYEAFLHKALSYKDLCNDYIDCPDQIRTVGGPHLAKRLFKMGHLKGFRFAAIPLYRLFGK